MIAFVPRVDVLTVHCPHLGQGAGLVPDVSSGAAGGVPADGDRVVAARLMLRPGWDGVRFLAPASLLPGAGRGPSARGADAKGMSQAPGERRLEVG
jgi:hypothetical protein